MITLNRIALARLFSAYYLASHLPRIPEFAGTMGTPPSVTRVTPTHVRLYLQETFTFLCLTAESAVALAPPSKSHSS